MRADRKKDELKSGTRKKDELRAAEEGKEKNMGGIKQIAIETFISAAQRFGKTKEETVQPLADEIGISIEEAREQIEKNWERVACAITRERG